MAKKSLNIDVDKLRSNDPSEWKHFAKNMQFIFMSNETKYLYDEDVFQDTLIVLVEKLRDPSFDADKNLVNLTFGIYRNILGKKSYNRDKFALRRSITEDGEFRDLMPEDLPDGKSEQEEFTNKEHVDYQIDIIKEKLLKEFNKRNRENTPTGNFNWFDFLIDYTNGELTLYAICEKYEISYELARQLRARLQKVLGSAKLKKGKKDILTARTIYEYRAKKKKQEIKRQEQKCQN